MKTAAIVCISAISIYEFSSDSLRNSMEEVRTTMSMNGFPTARRFLLVLAKGRLVQPWCVAH